jgi:hypothetical protein
MKPYNEQEFNKLCAEFFEWEFVYKKGYVNGYSTIINNFIGSEYVPIIHLKFHSDWNWIMEVVEKIQYYKALIISNNHCEIHFMPEDGVRINIGRRTTKEAVVQAIWEFLNWYNEQKQ